MTEDNTPPYTQSVFLPTESVPTLVISETRPGCADDYGTGPCGRRPEFIITRVQNVTGMPGMGKAVHTYACRTHLARGVHAATGGAVGPVTVSLYTGV